jgi:hypothetical protein
MRQTAVSWLLDWLSGEFIHVPNHIKAAAKEMERQQIEDAFNDAQDENFWDTSSEYFTEKFEQ